MSVSVIIPTFNREPLLEAAINSALHQTMPVVEIIVVDDGSTDQTEALVARLASVDSRIKLLKRQRGGANRARNAGSKLAVGEWLAFLDSDDVWEHNKLAMQMQAINSHEDVVACFTGLRHIGVGREKIYLPPEKPSLDDIRATNVLSSTSTAVIKKTVFWEIGGFDPNLPSCQDWDLWFRLRQKGTFVTVREPLVKYNSGPHERISSNVSRVIDGHRIIFERLLADIEHDTDSLRRISARHKVVLAEVYLRFGDSRKAIGLCLTSLLSHPSPWAIRILSISSRACIAEMLTNIRKLAAPALH
ncbi:glycosyltransferase family 2 protein [Microvirga sp. 3-52]|nr:glycosyltransferase family 2 protein [Microvirga sp. 3-52]